MKFSSLNFSSMFKKEEPMQTYDWKFGTRSKNKLEGVHPDLVEVATLALSYSSVDFGITQGLRTEAEQKALLASKKSQTMKSRHLTGHAIDVAAYEGANITWNFDKYIVIAEAVRKAAIEKNVEVGWGAAWLLSLNYYNSAEEAYKAYVNQRKKENRKPFIDGTHFQLSWNNYPK